MLAADKKPKTALARYRSALDNRNAVRRAKNARLRSGGNAPDKAEEIELLVGILALAAAVAYKIGLWAEKRKATPIKAHGRKAKSTLRRGLETLARFLAGGNNEVEKLFFLPPLTTKSQDNLLIL